MLFDLRGKGRRRTVQVIYLSLAILMGGGLVLFGIGGATNGGLFDAFSSDSGSLDTSSVYRDRIERYEKQLQTDPKNPRALAELTRAQVQEASVSGYNSSSGTFTEDGINGLKEAAATWERYLDTNPKSPDENLASLMVNAFGGGGLNDPARGAQAMAIVIAERGGTSALYSQLAVLYYAAGNVRKSVLAEKNAVEAAEPDQRKLVKARVASQRKQIDRAKLSTAVEQGAASQGVDTTP
jgi:tetratricopeptide (TPR) repeat protein